MKKERLLPAVMLLFLLFSSCSDIILTLTLPEEGDDVIIETLSSSVTGKEYVIYLGLPDGYTDSGEPYPLVVLTDGDDYFKGTWTRLRRAMASGELRDIVLVGIGYGRDINRRGEDLTPTSLPAWDTATYGADGELESGHGDDFLSFISVDLLPFVESAYNITSERSGRCMAGHSLGGLFSIYALTQIPGLFASFIASSPALSWDAYIIFPILGEWTDDPGRNHDITLFASLGDQEEFPNSFYLGALTERINDTEQAEATWTTYAYALHGQVWERAIPDGIIALFGGSD